MDLTYIFKFFEEREIAEMLLQDRARVKRIYSAIKEDPECPQEVKDYLVQRIIESSSSLDLASCLETSPDMLGVLAKSESKYVRMFTGRNPNCPRETLLDLINDPEVMVLVGIAQNSKCPEDIALALARKQIVNVSMALASNINIASEALFKELKKSENQYVLRALSENPNYPECYFH